MHKKAIIHIGQHKTATTAFQLVLSSFRKKLLSHGIFYPNLSPMGPSHNIIAYQLMNGSLEVLSKTIDHAKHVLDETGILLLSAENLEGVLSGQLDLSPMHDILCASFKEVEYIVVERDPFDYFESLYAEMSKWRVLLSYEAMANQILLRKSLHLSSDQFEWGFCFSPRINLKQISKQFSAKTSLIRFSEFTKGFPGMNVLADISNKLDRMNSDAETSLTSEILDAYLANKDLRNINLRLSEYQVELNYSSFFLGCNGEQLLNSNELKAIVMLCASKRMDANQKCKAQIKKRFDEMSFN